MGAGLIIDAFGELRDQQEQVKEDMEVRTHLNSPVVNLWSADGGQEEQGVLVFSMNMKQLNGLVY